jgi:hypothetical protein
MIEDPALLVTLASTSVAGLGITSAAALTGWRGWLELKRMEMDACNPGRVPPSPAARIEVADLRERIRKLEAIASGVDY